MKTLVFALSLLSLGLVCCSKSKPTYCVADALSQVSEITDSISNTTDSISDLEDNEESKEDKKSLLEFRCVTDTLNSDRAPIVHASYFLHDITGDGKEELWINIGSCEADKMLKVFTIDNGKARKIYEGDGGHSDYFIYKGDLVCVMCNTGAGVVITYKFDGKQVTDSMVKFSTWNENGSALSEPHDSIADEKLKYWEDFYGNYIELKPL